MSLPTVIEHMLKRPGVYLPQVEFFVAVGFLEGFDQACHGGVLAGFREWLVVKLGYGNNLAWCALVLESAFPRAKSAREALLQSGGQELALETLLRLLEAYWLERESREGLCRIYLRYHEWPRHQDWYGPEFPLWNALEGNSPPPRHANPEKET